MKSKSQHIFITKSTKSIECKMSFRYIFCMDNDASNGAIWSMLWRIVCYWGSNQQRKKNIHRPHASDQMMQVFARSTDANTELNGFQDTAVTAAALRMNKPPGLGVWEKQCFPFWCKQSYAHLRKEVSVCECECECESISNVSINNKINNKSNRMGMKMKMKMNIKKHKSWRPIFEN